MSTRNPGSLLLVCLAAAAPAVAQGAPDPEWPGFRGPGRDGVGRQASPPLAWSDEQNIAWKAALPGPGSSSPIVVGGRVYVTCYSGYGVDRDEPGEPEDLQHHLVCVERATGKLVWQRTVPGNLDGEARQVQLNEHGFASPTPATDGETIYTYFGKTGVVAFDLDGELRWQSDLGTIEREDGEDPLGEFRPRRPDGTPVSLRWGAAASPLPWGELVIVNASEESDSIRALDRRTGDLVWKRASPRLEGSSISPIVVGERGAEVLIVVLAGQVWGLDPATGDRLWQVDTGTETGMVPTPVADDRVVYTFGGKGDAHAIRFAPRSDRAESDAKQGTGHDAERDTGRDAESRVVWTGKNVGIPSPVLRDGQLFLVDSRGFGTCLDAGTGEVVFNGRLPGRTGGVYASPLWAAGRLYVVTRERGTYVFSADGKFELLAQNELAEDDTRFNASPAVVGDQLFLRSDKYLYCIAGS